MLCGYNQDIMKRIPVAYSHTLLSTFYNFKTAHNRKVRN